MGESISGDNLITDHEKSPKITPKTPAESAPELSGESIREGQSATREGLDRRSDSGFDTAETFKGDTQDFTFEPVPHDADGSSAADTTLVSDNSQAVAPDAPPLSHEAAESQQDIQAQQGTPAQLDVETLEDSVPPLSNFDMLMSKLFSTRQLLMNATPRARLWGWLGPLLVACVGGLARVIRLGTPNTLVFDETYYVKGAYAMMKVGYEADWPKDIDDTWNARNFDVYLDKADYVVHPPLGKWMIAFGMWLGDPENAAFWRLSTALVSIIAIFLIARTVRNMTGSLTVGLVAGGLFAIDGTAIVHARTGLLDSFLMFWVVVAFALLVKDRQWRRTRLATFAASRLDLGLDVGNWGPRLGWSWWRFAAAIALGLSCGIKWSGLYFVAVFCVMAVLWDWGARRSIGARGWFWGGFWRDAVPAALVMLPTALAAYILSWSTWLVNAGAYGRMWFVDNPGSYPSWFPSWVVESSEGLRSLWHYHTQMMSFHTGLTSEHTYQAQAWGWLLQLRPTSFYWQKTTDGSVNCGSDTCAAAVTSLGNPLIWWLGTIALLGLVYVFVLRTDWIAGTILAGVAAGWVPWMFFPERTIFTFYTIVITPFMCMALAYGGFLLWERFKDGPRSRKVIRNVLIGVGSLIVVVSIFFYPIWTAIPVPYEFWRLHMWLPSWI